jgi:hypothetical protein
MGERKINYGYGILEFVSYYLLIVQSKSFLVIFVYIHKMYLDHVHRLYSISISS